MPSDIFKLGSLGEWFKPAVLKTAEQQCSVSSNLTASAKHLNTTPLAWCFVFLPMFLSMINKSSYGKLSLPEVGANKGLPNSGTTGLRAELREISALLREQRDSLKRV